jgi:hypothetical protein
MALTRRDRREAMTYLAKQLDAASFGERHSIVELACAALSLSRQTVYRELAKVGWTSGRKPRVDKGTTGMPLDTMNFLSNLQRTSTRANGKVTMSVPTAMGIAIANGHKPLSKSRNAAVLRSAAWTCARSRAPRATSRCARCTRITFTRWTRRSAWSTT